MGDYINHIHICAKLYLTATDEQLKDFKWLQDNATKCCDREGEWVEYDALPDDEQIGVFDPCDKCIHAVSINIY